MSFCSKQRLLLFKLYIINCFSLVTFLCFVLGGGRVGSFCILGIIESWSCNIGRVHKDHLLPLPVICNYKLQHPERLLFNPFLKTSLVRKLTTFTDILIHYCTELYHQDVIPSSEIKSCNYTITGLHHCDYGK